MSLSSIEGQESKTVSYYCDHPPQYNTSQPSEDILTSILENERTCRNIRLRLNEIGAEMFDKMERKEERQSLRSIGYISAAEFYQDIGRLATEMGQSLAKLANIAKERAVKNSDLCTVISKLSRNEFNRIYDSSKRHSLTTKQVERADNSSTSDFLFLRDRFFELSAEVEPNQSPPSYDTTYTSKLNDDDDAAATKPSVLFWVSLKKIIQGQLGSKCQVD
ncbi:hypothetical protein PEBR_02503 [Penicillium brasilianum]|uniref:Uncharacterized protein n=1 Tax=Penicillium brasilianum TaxID=104259 RepID=A0A1S9S0Q1_PENBI|nr:hypothetical protein PEBR_02503 [Penicillium brasilianum]